MRPLAILLFGLLLLGCRKEKTGDVATPLPTPTVPDHRSTIMLKEIVEQGLPSPYFFFEYNDSNYLTKINFASGFFQYDVQYRDGKIKAIENKLNNSILKYAYTGGKISSITRFNSGNKAWNYKLEYLQDRLAEVKWFSFDTVGDSTLQRKVELFYGNDGNLSAYKDYWLNDANQLALSSTTEFSNYDNGKNVDDFYLFKEFFEDVLYLPGVKMQKNNPGTLKIKGQQNEYEINYQYSYQNSLPIVKQGIFKVIRGNDSGKAVNLQTSYSYY